MKIKKLLFLFCFLSMSGANAASLSYSFPGFNGNYTYPNGSLSEAFDLGVQFSSIQNAELLIEASGTAGLLQICNGNICSIQTFGQDLLWGFKFETGFNTVNGSQDLTNAVLPYVFDITANSGFLLDGSGELFLQPNFIYSTGFTTITILQPSTYQIINVALNVEGTVIPLPPSILLLLSGLTGLLIMKKQA